MILFVWTIDGTLASKPRASGDDPTEMRSTQTFFA